jgi:hypothetical protein
MERTINTQLRIRFEEQKAKNPERTILAIASSVNSCSLPWAAIDVITKTSDKNRFYVEFGQFVLHNSIPNIKKFGSLARREMAYNRPGIIVDDEMVAALQEYTAPIRDSWFEAVPNLRKRYDDLLRINSSPDHSLLANE